MTTIYKVNASRDSHINVTVVEKRLNEARSVLELTVSKDAVKLLDDLVSEALDSNLEDETFSPQLGDELVHLLGFLGAP